MTNQDDWAAHLDPAEPAANLDPATAGALDRVAANLADEAMWDEPPRSLRGRLLAAAVEVPGTQPLDRPTAIGDPAAGSEWAGPPPISDRQSSVLDPMGPVEELTPATAKARRRWLGRAAGLAAVAAVAAVAFLAGTIFEGGVGGPGDVTVYEVAGTELAPDAQAQVDVEVLGPGVAITLNITGLPPAGEGEYYAGWLSGPDGRIGIGTFHWREGGVPIELWSGVDTARYPNLAVTLQREGEPTTSSGQAVLVGTLVDPIDG